MSIFAFLFSRPSLATQLTVLREHWRKTDELQQRVWRDEEWLKHCLAVGAEWRGPRCARCTRPLVGGYTMRVSEEVIDMVCINQDECTLQVMKEQANHVS